MGASTLTLAIGLATAVRASGQPFGTAELSPAPMVADAQPRAAQTPGILYINFDGGVLHSGCGNEAHYNCSTLADRFHGYVGPFTANDGIRVAILQATRKAVADFGLRVVVDRPPDDVDYTMVMYGDLGEQSFAGIAPYIDCGDVQRNDTSFAAAFDTSNTGSTVILQEAAHTWGLEHVDAEFDILNPFKSGGLTQRFQDECFPIVSNTELQQTSGSCNQIHTKFCDAGFQNSWQEMRYLFGPPVPDTVAPELEITSPADGETFVLPTRIPLAGVIRDELDPQYYELQVFEGDALLFEGTNIRLDLLLDGPPPRDYDLRVVVMDQAGNVGEDRIRFSVLPEGSELPDPLFELEAEDSSGCAIAPGRTALGPGPWALLGLLLFGRLARPRYPHR